MKLEDILGIPLDVNKLDRSVVDDPKKASEAYLDSGLPASLVAVCYEGACTPTEIRNYGKELSSKSKYGLHLLEEKVGSAPGPDGFDHILDLKDEVLEQYADFTKEDWNLFRTAWNAGRSSISVPYPRSLSEDQKNVYFSIPEGWRQEMVKWAHPLQFDDYVDLQRRTSGTMNIPEFFDQEGYHRTDNDPVGLHLTSALTLRAYSTLTTGEKDIITSEYKPKEAGFILRSFGSDFSAYDFLRAGWEEADLGDLPFSRNWEENIHSFVRILKTASKNHQVELLCGLASSSEQKRYLGLVLQYLDVETFLNGYSLLSEFEETLAFKLGADKEGFAKYKQVESQYQASWATLYNLQGNLFTEIPVEVSMTLTKGHIFATKVGNIYDFNQRLALALGDDCMEEVLIYSQLYEKWEPLGFEERAIFVELVSNTPYRVQLSEMSKGEFGILAQAYCLGSKHDLELFMDGFRIVTERGDLKPWAQHIIDHFKPKGIGGGNYREIGGQEWKIQTKPL